MIRCDDQAPPTIGFSFEPRKVGHYYIMYNPLKYDFVNTEEFCAF